ncbi:dihydrodipicolinate synthase family protein [Martelella sp. AD-3]|uniref:dihydrodipicolinate synthase family protein n=1 Tax=Martelella sp. AD-3 TaxID=686597 RepID=UPI000465F8B9|nr:dihydrodipicolinate synthase family protein [Martelella sp. AD-3]AMM85577.1 dihydrodipicolinate synthase family protein [Martelella sp. AD-3]
MKKGTSFHGIIPPVVSTFTRDEEIDTALYRREVRYLLDAGVHGISPGGSTGEGAALTNAELVQMIEIIKSENRAGVPIVAGVARCSTAAAIETAMAAKKAGADALMVTPTFYNVLVPDAAGNKRFYGAIFEAVGLPIIIYNVVPQNEISSELFSELLDIEHVIGVKQSVGGIMAMYDMRIACGDRGMVYAATDEMLHSCFALGADGAISAILALFPRLSVRMWDLTRAGKYDEALKIQNRLYPLWKIVRGPQFPARMKAAAGLLGRDCGFSKSPMSDVPEELVDRMSAILKGVKDE